jgi:hypothetical protein
MNHFIVIFNTHTHWLLYFLSFFRYNYWIIKCPCWNLVIKTTKAAFQMVQSHWYLMTQLLKILNFNFLVFFFFEMFKHEALMNFDSYNNVFDVWRRLNLRKNWRKLLKTWLFILRDIYFSPLCLKHYILGIGSQNYLIN